jgi:aldehyde dehydrogenase (NAD+)
MKMIDQVYIDGAFVTPHGTEMFDLYNPATEQVIGRVRLADADDARRAIAAAKAAGPAFARTGKAERIDMLRRLHDAVAARTDDLLDAVIAEYGAPIGRAEWTTQFASGSFLVMAQVLESYEFTQRVGQSTVVREPVGVAGLITPWNANYGFICSKLATALAAGCTAVIKPSEMSATQTQLITECLHAAGLPKGVINIVTGRGEVVGAELVASAEIAKISFTGSTAVGKSILRGSAETIKRVTLELGGKSPIVILDDTDLDWAIPAIVAAGFGNNGQACINGTRILVPEPMQAPLAARLKAAVEAAKTGDPRDPATLIGPLVSKKQHERVKGYIAKGLAEGATLLTGGAERPDGVTAGYFVKPTVFTNVTNDMTIAREEIFGPVVSVLTYKTENEAVAIANDTPYGLQAYVLSGDAARARAVAARLQAGRVAINGAPHDPLAPFGGFKQSGLGREYGVYGLESFLETKALLG